MEQLTLEAGFGSGPLTYLGRKLSTTEIDGNETAGWVKCDR